MYDAILDNIEFDRVIKYQLTRDGVPITYSQVLDLWRDDIAFRAFFTTLLAECPFTAYRWETPSLTSDTLNRPFEFVLLNAAAFASRKSDAITYSDYFTDDDTDYGIVSFVNLSGDATLVVPSPRTQNDAYGHLAAFIRLAPASQIDAFWRVMSAVVRDQISSKPLWLSAAGGGVAWLHVRLDSQPKYYGYTAYK